MIDVNDHPKFLQDSYQLILSEGHVTAENVNATSLASRAIDEDPNSLLTFSLLTHADEWQFLKMFQVNASTGVLSAKIGEEFNTEERDFYNLTLIVRDSNEPVRSATSQVYVFVQILNDNVPTIISPPSTGQPARHAVSFELPCILETPALLYRVAASDPDHGAAGVVRFTIIEKRVEYPFWRLISASSQINSADGMQLHLNSSTGNIYILSGLSCWKAEDVVTIVIVAKDNTIPFNAAPHNITVSFTVTDFGISKTILLIFYCFSFLAVILPIFAGIYFYRHIRPLRIHAKISENDSSESTESSSSSMSASSPPGSSSGSDTQSSPQDSSSRGSDESSNRAVSAQYRNQHQMGSAETARIAFSVDSSPVHESTVIESREKTS